MQTKYEYNIDGKYFVNIDVMQNDYDINVDNMFCMAARKNKKRKFLFVSKVLGKHIPVDPKIAILTGRLLGYKYLEDTYKIKIDKTEKLVNILNDNSCFNSEYQEIIKDRINLPEDTLIIGFAETATALGHSFFESFSNNAYYIHTTRDLIDTKDDVITFEEEHSHATSHRLYPLQEDILKSDRPIVFVDDEITTGKTTINIIESIQKKYPRKRYCIVSILDWRKDVDREFFKKKEAEMGIKIDTVSLVSGQLVDHDIDSEYFANQDLAQTKTYDATEIHHIDISNIYSDIVNKTSVGTDAVVNDCPYLKFAGRFGINSSDNSYVNQVAMQTAEYLKKFIKGQKVLCLGTGEFMYIPMLVASYIDNCKYHSTTRSPIYASDEINYGVQNKYYFKSPKDATVDNYVYNIPTGYYDDILIFLEREGNEGSLDSMIEAVKKTGAKRVYLITHSSKRRGEISERKQA